MVADLHRGWFTALERLADMICNTVTDWSHPALFTAAFFRTAMAQSPQKSSADYEDFGHDAWDFARHYMKTGLASVCLLQRR